MQKAHQVLKDVFGFSSFRLSQEAVIHRLLVDNGNALVLFPTGGGKSLTYQVPALCLDGLTLVISPLIALMKDQVDSLCNLGIKAANLDSTLTPEKAVWVKGEVISGSLKILYVAPERLNNEGFMSMMGHVKISLLAVDESHCISQWGASFRPDYLKIARFAEEHDVERVLCLTATATSTVIEDICDSFIIDRKVGVFRTPVFRSNLAFQVKVAETMEQKLASLIPFLKGRTGPAIIYVTLQKHTEEIAERLAPHGLQPMIYHAGLPSEQRERVQLAFMRSDNGIVCATIAFGMGIDKANIRQVVHLFMPKTLENYSQEVGRAGRDNLPSTCLMFLSAHDIPTLEGFCRGDTCHKKDLQLWLQEVALKEPSSDHTIDFNHYQQGKVYDIRSNVLGLCYAQLELDYQYIRAVTPFYSLYELSTLTAEGWKKVLGDNSRAAKTIRFNWRSKGKKYEIDVVDAAARSEIDREELSKQISSWELGGLLQSKASQVRARYLVLKPLPKPSEDIQQLVDKMYQRMLEREKEAVQKLHQVIDFATATECLAFHLANYFGDKDAVPGGRCGLCTVCISGNSIKFIATTHAFPSPHQVQAILQACPERDDPRLLARMAFGITSPRLTANKWSTSHPLFGSMVSVDFNALVEAFDQECKKAEYTKTEAAVTNKKRPYTQSSACSSTNGGNGGGSRGSTAGKRARGARGR